MQTILMILASIGLYGTAAGVQACGMRSQTIKSRNWVLILGFIAVLLHAGLLHNWIDVDAGQNLTRFNILSLVAWLVALLALVMGLTKPIENIVLFIFPLAAMSIVLDVIMPGEHVLQTGGNLRQLFHILLSISAFSVLSLAGLQAILLAMQERRLRVKHTLGIWRAVPPLETMEDLMFQIIAFGFFLLTVLILSSIYFYHALLFGVMLNKTILAATAWVIFAGLLLARLFLGWRGKKTIYGTLGGQFLLLCILMLQYFQVV